MPIPLCVWQINFSLKLSVTGDLHKRQACLLPQPTVQDVLLRTEREIRVKRVLADGKEMCVLLCRICRYWIADILAGIADIGVHF